LVREVKNKYGWGKLANKLERFYEEK